MMRERFEELYELLNGNGIDVMPLDRKRIQEVESNWRAVFGNAFEGKNPYRKGTKAESEFQHLECSHFLIITFSAKVAGTPIHPVASGHFGLECRGRLLSLSRFHAIEFFISPVDFAWTMVHTHEDHASGGPYFAWRK